jgi:hypothetical protein
METPKVLTLARALLFSTAVLAGCSDRNSPEEVSLSYKRLELAGDRLAIRPMLSSADSAALAHPAGAEFRKSLFEDPQKAQFSTTSDSARVGRRAGDTAWVAVFVTGPNWESIGGRYDFSGSKMIDRGEDLKLAATLPRITSIDTVTLLREQRGLRHDWRLYWNLPLSIETRPVWILAMTTDSALATRAAAAQRFLDLTRGKRPAGKYVDSVMTNVIMQAGYADSIEYTLGLEPTPSLAGGAVTERFTGLVTNRSSRPIKRLEITVLFTSGETTEATSYDIPPKSKKEILGFGNWAGAIKRHSLSHIQFARE